MAERCPGCIRLGYRALIVKRNNVLALNEIRTILDADHDAKRLAISPKLPNHINGFFLQAIVWKDPGHSRPRREANGAERRKKIGGVV